MKINKAELQAALEKVKPGLASKDLIEQATSFAFTGGRVVTYNDEISITHPVSGLDDVTGAVKAQALYAFLGKVKKDEIDLDWEDNQVVIKAGRSKAGLVFESEVKLPIEEIGDIDKWQKLPEGFIAGLKLCHPCCSRDMSRPVLTCVHINGVVIEASDSFQIIRYTLEKKVPGKGFLIPATSARALVRYDVKEMARGESWVHFRTEDGTVFSARIIGEDFPDVSKILEMDGAEFGFPDAMQEALSRADVFVKKGAEEIPVVAIEVKGGQLKLSAKNEYGWFEEKMRTKSGGDFCFCIGIELVVALFEKLRSCIIGTDRIGLSGDGWQHVISIMSAGEEDENE